MTAISLHATPRWRVVASEQVRTVGLQMRAAGALLLVMLALYGGVAIQVARSVHGTNVTRVAHGTVDFGYAPEISAIIAVLALLLPIAMWNEEDPTRRAYHWSMPMARSSHALTKTFAGWVWLMVVTALFLSLVAAIDAITQRIVGTPSRHAVVSGWELLVPFTAGTVAYLLASAAAVGARTPLVWIFGPFMIYTGVGIILAMMGHPDGSRAMLNVLSGFYGASAAMAGQLRVNGAPSPDRWLGAAALWGGAATLLLYAVSRRRRRQ